MATVGTVPHSIRLLRDLTMQLSVLEAILDENHPYLNAIASAAPDADLTELPIPTDLVIRYFQAMLLSGISFYGGIFVDAIRQYDTHDTRVKIIWESGITDTFQWGVDNADFRRFTKYFGSKLFRPATVPFSFSKSYLAHIAKLIVGYTRQLEVIHARLTHFVSKKTHFLSYLESEFPADLFFITMACLPTDDLNGLLMFVQQFLPDTLEIRNPSGKRVNVCQLFGTSSLDVFYLIEKLRVYFTLYYSTDMPIIKEITQMKTKEYLLGRLKNTAALDQTLYQLEALKGNQLDIRLKLYKLLMIHFSMIIKS